MQLVLENKSEAGNCDDRKFISKSSDRFGNMSSEDIAVMKENEFVESLSLGNGDVDFNDTLEKVGSTLDDLLTKEFLTGETVENHKIASSLPVREDSKSPSPSNVQNVTALQENHVTSNENDTLPVANEIVPEENDVTPQEIETIPQEKELLPQENVIVSQEKEILPQEKEITPQEEEILPKETDASPDENDVSAKENNAICTQVAVDEDDSITKIDDIPSKLITDDDTANTNSKTSDSSIADLLNEDDDKVQSTDNPSKPEESVDIIDSNKITESKDLVIKKEKEDEINATEVAEKPAETSSAIKEEPRDELEDMLDEIVNGCARKSPETAVVAGEPKMDVVKTEKAEESVREDEPMPMADKGDNLDSDVEMTDCSVDAAAEKKSSLEDNLPDNVEARKSAVEVPECKAPKEEVVDDIIDDVEPMEVDGALPTSDVATKNAENMKESKQASPPLANDAMVFIAHPDIDFTELKKEKNIDDSSVSIDLIESEKMVPDEVSLDNENDILSGNVPTTISNGHKVEVSKNEEPCKKEQKPIEKSLDTNTSNIKMTSKNSSVVIDSLEVLSDDEMSDNHKTEEKAVKSPKVDDEKSDAKSVECVSLDDDDDLMMVSTVKDKEKLSDSAVLEKINVKDNAILKENEESELARSDDKTNSLIVLDDDDCGVIKQLETSKSDVGITKLPNNTNDVAKNDEKKSEGETIVIEEESTKKQDSKVTSDKSELEEDKIVFEELPVAKVEDIKITPILPLNFMTTFKPTLEKMSREDLEEYCLVKIVEAIAKRSKLSVVESELKAQSKHMEMLRKTLAGVTKQNRDLEVVMKNLTNEHKKRRTEIIEPVKISRSVGFQVGNSSLRPKSIKPIASQPNYEYKEQSNNIAKNNSQANKPQKPVPTVNHQSSPPVANTNSSDSNVMPRKILHPSRHRPHLPARPPVKPPVKNSPTSATAKTLNHLNNVNTKSAEKRPSETSIDLTDDEPPAKLPAINNSQTKISRVPNTNANNATPNAPNRITYTMKNNSPANNNFSKAIVFTSKQSPNQQQAAVTVSPVTNNPPVVNIKVGIPIKPNVTTNQRPTTQLLYSRHPAPLPATPTSKQASNPNWKWLPPRPELKISRVSNGIVISWIMDIPMDSRYEDIASYQIYAYQETSTPPQTELWKKIGDVKALPLPMACTLTQFMVGYKYFFAVRAVDVKSRVGQFSTPGYILLNREK